MRRSIQPAAWRPLWGPASPAWSLSGSGSSTSNEAIKSVTRAACASLNRSIAWCSSLWFVRMSLSPRYEIAGRRFQVQVQVQVLLCGGYVAMAQQLGNLRDRHPRPKAQLRVSAAQVVRRQLGLADGRAVFLHQLKQAHGR